MPFNLSFDPLNFVGVILAFVVGVTIHEFMHAYTAWRLGDTTALRLGRITLNPVAHFDPLGALMFLLMAFGVPVIAWGKPVPVNTAALRNGRRGMAMVAFAGPLSNLVLAAFLAIPIRFGLPMPAEVEQILRTVISVNLLLFSFNLIPLPPLDGYNILTGILSSYWATLLEPLRRYGPALLLMLIFVGPYLGIDWFGRAVTPIRELTSTLVGV